MDFFKSMDTFKEPLSEWRKQEESTLLIGNPPLKNFVSRTYNTLNFLPNKGPHFTPLIGVENMSYEEQEQILTRHLLIILNGVESSLINVHRVDENKVGFTVDTRIESSLRDLAIQIAQLGGYYHTVTRFAENWATFEQGQVNHALASAIREFMKDYFILLTQMEALYAKGNLSLQKLWFFINPTYHSMSIMNSIVIEIEEKGCRGGSVLTLLFKRTASMASDDRGQILCTTLAQKASAPYFQILENWIYKGKIKDPFNEFFVEDTDKDGEMLERSDNYWEKRYVEIKDCCPSFLWKIKNQILKIGKYLNVIRQCGKDVITYQGGKIGFSIHERDYVNVIDKAYLFASRRLLDLLLNEYDLMNRLKSVKHYLLMDQGDFIVQFLDLTESELCKPIDDLNPVRLESLLELALRTSSSCADPYKDSVKVQLLPYRMRDQIMDIISIQTPLEKADFPSTSELNYTISGFEGFSFSYEVKWPISLVLNERAIKCYQLIFRHFLYCKHVERELYKVWITQKNFKALDLKKEVDRSSSFALRQKMLNYVQNLQYYLAFEVIEPAWHTFISTMNKVGSVDEVLSCHMNLVSSLLSDSMLTSPPLLEKMGAILDTCLAFTQRMLKPTRKPSTIQFLSERFSKNLVDFLKEVSSIVQNPNQSSQVVNIIHRMNFNNFYTEALEEQAEGLTAKLNKSITLR